MFDYKSRLETVDKALFTKAYQYVSFRVFIPVPQTTKTPRDLFPTVLLEVFFSRFDGCSMF